MEVIILSYLIPWSYVALLSSRGQSLWSLRSVDKFTSGVQVGGVSGEAFKSCEVLPFQSLVAAISLSPLLRLMPLPLAFSRRFAAVPLSSLLPTCPPPQQAQPQATPTQPIHNARHAHPCSILTFQPPVVSPCRPPPQSKHHPSSAPTAASVITTTHVHIRAYAHTSTNVRARSHSSMRSSEGYGLQFVDRNCVHQVFFRPPSSWLWCQQCVFCRASVPYGLRVKLHILMRCSLDALLCRGV